jgi:hypothetical protein
MIRYRCALSQTGPRRGAQREGQGRKKVKDCCRQTRHDSDKFKFRSAAVLRFAFSVEDGFNSSRLFLQPPVFLNDGAQHGSSIYKSKSEDPPILPSRRRAGLGRSGKLCCDGRGRPSYVMRSASSALVIWFVTGEAARRT